MKGNALILSSIAAIGGFLFGYDLVAISGAQIFLRDYFHLSSAQLGFAVSSAVLGCTIGSAAGAHLSDRIGVKAVMRSAGLLLIAGSVGTALPAGIAAFNAFRILGGIGVGLLSLASPMYIAEIAPAKERGRLGLMYQLAITMGALAVTVVSWLLAGSLSHDTCWRWMLASIAIPSAAFLALLTRMPHSPRWLAGRGRTDEAYDILAAASGPDSATGEMQDIVSSLDRESGSFRELLAPGMGLALLTGLLLAFFNNWTGWGATGFYLPTIFRMSGYNNASDAIGMAVIPNAVNILLALVAIRLVDRVGRRPLWIVTSAAMAVALVLMGIAFHIRLGGSVILILTLCVLAPHAIGLGGLPWLMMSELFPTRIRARGVSVCTTFLWLSAFTGPLAFPRLVAVSQKTIGSPAGVFWIYASIALLALVFGVTLLPETKGKTLEAIAKSWRT